MKLVECLQRSVAEAVPTTQTLIDTLLPLMKLTVTYSYELQSIKFDALAKWSQLLKDSGLTPEGATDIIIEHMRLNERIRSEMLGVITQVVDKFFLADSSQLIKTVQTVMDQLLSSQGDKNAYGI